MPSRYIVVYTVYTYFIVTALQVLKLYGRIPRIFKYLHVFEELRPDEFETAVSLSPLGTWPAVSGQPQIPTILVWISRTPAKPSGLVPWRDQGQRITDTGGRPSPWLLWPPFINFPSWMHHPLTAPHGPEALCCLSFKDIGAGTNGGCILPSPIPKGIVYGIK